MRLGYRLAGAVVAVVLVVGLGFAWRSSPLAGLVASERGHDRGRDHDRERERDDRRKELEAGGFHLDEAGELAGSLIQPAVLVGVVVAADRAHRRRRRDPARRFSRPG